MSEPEIIVREMMSVGEKKGRGGREINREMAEKTVPFPFSTLQFSVKIDL